ncbi:MAG: fibrobacter succinogenes major paralogous domain-containing protein [Fibromonadales bacterium]|nr:fibrobacter succinogenes major paralogous domain-containing protein [Fibromonadales bacterium]
MKLAVLEPGGKGLSEDEQWMLPLIQSSIAGDFNKYSSITIIDRQNLEAIMAEWKHSMSGITSDEDAIKIGNLANASHILTGKITKTPKAFMLELAITDAETGKRKASYSPKAVIASQLEDLSAIKEASADLLKQLGVSLTDSQLAELKGPTATAQVQAQTALAHGVVAERQGTSVAALSYYYQAAAFDPTLVEAVKRSSIMSANISGINIGENIRNDIAWRKKWVEQLKETEETFYKIINSAASPYTLYYSTVIETKSINYQKETASLSISLNLLANAEWFNALQRSFKAAQVVYDGLNATNRKKDWGLNEWPQWKSVSETNPFYKEKRYNISVEFELVNQHGDVLASQIANLYLRMTNDNFSVSFNTNQSSILTFNGVEANDISDNLTIRLASVNGKSPQTARFPIIAVSTKEFPKYQIIRTTFTDSRDGKKYGAVEIGGTWMAENLNYNANGSKCYENQESNCQKYGRLYDWETAKKACPNGWHLPSNREWLTLYLFTSGILKATSGWHNNIGKATDEFGFSALPGGFYSSNYTPPFNYLGAYGYWWSSTEKDGDTSMAYNRYMEYSDYLGSNDSRKAAYFSVRCVQD